MKGKKLDLSVEDVLRKLKAGDLTIEEAKRKLAALNIRRISDLARLDTRRAHRIGVPEVILAEGKSPEAVARTAKKMAEESGYALVTRATEGHLRGLRAVLSRDFELDHNERARTVVVKRRGHVFPKLGKVGVLAAGTADIPVAEEVAVSAEVMGCEVIKAYDVGIAGIHRLFEPLREMTDEGVSAVVAVAGNGGVPAIGRGQPRGCARRRRANLHRLRGWHQGPGGAHDDAPELLAEVGRGQHRQRVRGGGLRGPHSQAIEGGKSRLNGID
jgi:NCAIR mutase (PurE)-related protein